MSDTATTLAKIVDNFARVITPDAGLPGSLKFDFGGDGKVHLDGRAGAVSAEDKPADCTVAMSLETFMAMVEGRQDPTAAFMQGKMKLTGDMGLAMKLGPILQKARDAGVV